MKKQSVFVLLLFICSVGKSQLSWPNMTVPPVLPPPMQVQGLKQTGKKSSLPCHSFRKLSDFKLPCCITSDTAVATASMIQVFFDSSGCLQPEWEVKPSFLLPSEEPQTVVVTAGSVSISKPLNVFRQSAGSTMSDEYRFSAEVEQLNHMVNKLRNGAPFACVHTGGIVPSGDLVYRTTNVCCDSAGTCWIKQRLYSGSFQWKYQATCNLPINGIPFVEALSSVINASASLTVTVDQPVDCSHPVVCRNVKGNWTLSGVAEPVLPPGILNADVRLYGGRKLERKNCDNDSQLPPLSPGDVIVSGRVTSAWGLITHSFKYPVYKMQQKP